MESTWESRDLPVLELIVAHFDDVDANRLDIEQLVDLAGIPKSEVLRALKALHEADPPYIVGMLSA